MFRHGRLPGARAGAALRAPRPAGPARRRISTSVVLPVGVVAFTGCFHLYRGAPVDGAVFLLTAAALALDAAGVFPSLRRGPASRPRAVPALAAGIPAATVLVLAPEGGVADAVTLASLGAASLLWSWPSALAHESRAAPEPDRARRLRRAAVLWASLGITAALWELTASLLGSSSAVADARYPSLSDLIGPLFDDRASRAVLVLAWLALGYALLRIGSRGRE